MIISSSKLPAIFGAFIGGVSLASGALVTVDFNTDAKGATLNAGDGTEGSGIDIEVIQPYADLFSSGVGITFENPGNFLTLYDSDLSGGLDDDLESPYQGGNGNQSGGYGNILIHQTNNSGQPRGSVNNIDVPNDDGDGGDLIIRSGLFLTSFVFSYTDLDNGKERGSTITFTDTSTMEFVTISFADLEDGSGSVFSVFNVDFANRHVNDVDSITLANLQTVNPSLNKFDKIQIVTEGSGGLGEFSVNTFEVSPIPEPATSSLLALGVFGFTIRRRR